MTEPRDVYGLDPDTNPDDLIKRQIAGLLESLADMMRREIDAPQSFTPPGRELLINTMACVGQYLSAEAACRRHEVAPHRRGPSLDELPNVPEDKP